MLKFGLIGVGGFVAARHMQAIKHTGNVMIAALDPNDSVGIIDTYYPKAKFFTEYERFDRFLDKTKRENNLNQVDLISICSPNYLHDSHIRFALRSGADVICEKPLVLNPWNIDALKSIEQDTGKKINTILQLRLHKSIVDLKEKVEKNHNNKKYDVDLTYITSRGNWYLQSWKGDNKKSGGIATNIGVHFFDMLSFVFGNVQENVVNYISDTKASGFIELDQARVRWFLSIDYEDIPKVIKEKGSKTYRSITIDSNELEFSEGFTDLHNKSYEEILAGNGYGLDENYSCINTVSQIRLGKLQKNIVEEHPLLNKINKK